MKSDACKVILLINILIYLVTIYGFNDSITIQQSTVLPGQAISSFRHYGSHLTIECKIKSSIIEFTEKYSNTFKVINSHFYHIKFFDKNSTGLYVCIDKKSKKSNYGYRYLTQSAHELIDPKWKPSIVAKLDSSVVLECKRNHLVDYVGSVKTWIVNNKRIIIHSKRLRLKKVRYDHNGHYECVLETDKLAYGSLHTNLSVVGQPKELANRETLIIVLLGQEIEFFCTYYASPEIKFNWRNNKGIVSSEPSYSFRIKNVTSEHIGKYTCSPVGYKVIAGTIWIQLAGPPASTLDGTVVPLYSQNLVKCPVYSTTPISLKWWIRDAQDSWTIMDKAKDRVIRLNSNDEKVHLKCEATNDFGKLELEFTTVKQAAHHDIQKRDTVLPSRSERLALEEFDDTRQFGIIDSFSDEDDENIYEHSTILKENTDFPI